MTTDRRTFLATAGGLAVAAGIRPAHAAERPRTGQPVPMIHVTDLFRPHDDPDDHWDLACVYALAHAGRVDLRGILIEYGTFYRFRQADVLPHLSKRVQRFFAFMFRQGRIVPKSLRATSASIEWLHALDTAPEPDLMDCIHAMDRNMWCTGGFLHAAGQTVTRDGQIVPLGDAKDPVFTFDTVDVSCSPEAITRWKPAEVPTDRFLFHVRDQSRYSSAMTNALRSLLKQLP